MNPLPSRGFTLITLSPGHHMLKQQLKNVTPYFTCLTELSITSLFLLEKCSIMPIFFPTLTTAAQSGEMPIQN